MLKMKLLIDVEFDDLWIDENNQEEVEWLVEQVLYPDNKLLLTKDIGDYVDITSIKIVGRSDD